jgi:hypothetical protein
MAYCRSFRANAKHKFIGTPSGKAPQSIKMQQKFTRTNQYGSYQTDYAGHGQVISEFHNFDPELLAITGEGLYQTHREL